MRIPSSLHVLVIVGAFVPALIGCTSAEVAPFAALCFANRMSSWLPIRSRHLRTGRPRTRQSGTMRVSRVSGLRNRQEARASIISATSAVRQNFNASSAKPLMRFLRSRQMRHGD